MGGGTETEPVDHWRRRLLGGVAGTMSGLVGIVAATTHSEGGRSAGGEDGIPDALKRSPRFHRRLEAVFGEGIESLDPGRRELMVDVRYVGGTVLSERTKDHLRDLFRDNEVHLHWLEHPRAYDRETVRERYGTDIEGLLVDPDGFYWSQVEPFLRNVAFQLVVVPGRRSGPDRGKIRSRFFDAHVNGMNVGNRAAVAQRGDPETEAGLVFHEIAHLVLCHNSDPNNSGTMGQGTELDLTDREWELFRNGLDNVRETTGYDVVYRRCLWEEQLNRVLREGRPVP